MSDCDLCGGWGAVEFNDPVTRRSASVLCPACTPEGVDLDPRVEDPRARGDASMNQVGNHLVSIDALTDMVDDPTAAVQFGVVDEHGERHVYGDQSWIAGGRAVREAHPGGRVERRTVTITYGEWEATS